MGNSRPVRVIYQDPVPTTAQTERTERSEKKKKKQDNRQAGGRKKGREIGREGRSRQQ